MSHTPGPWWLSDHDWYVRATCNQGVNWRVAEVIEVLPEDEQAEANAFLIAAAPEMLEALQNIENDDGSIPEHAWQMIQNAIAKATGEEVDHE